MSNLQLHNAFKFSLYGIGGYKIIQIFLRGAVFLLRLHIYRVFHNLLQGVTERLVQGRKTVNTHHWTGHRKLSLLAQFSNQYVVHAHHEQP